MLENRSAARRLSVLDATQPIDAGSKVSIRALPAEARFVLRLPEASAQSLATLAGMNIALPINRASQNEGRMAARLGPDEWLLIVPEADAEMVLAEAAAQLGQHHHAFIDISHRNIAIEVSGTGAAEVINSGCPLDLGADHFAPGDATRSLLGKAEIVLFRLVDLTDARGQTHPRYRIECWRSFGRYVHGYLGEAARQYNVC